MSALAPSHTLIGVPPFPVRKLTVEEYHSLIREGFFKEDERFELLEGWVVPKMSRNPPHDTCIELTQAALLSRLPKGGRLRVPLAITTADSEPEPDFAVVSGPIRTPGARHPLASEVDLLIEVANTTLDTDRTVKARVYARAGIAVYWIINLVDRVIEVHTEPSGFSGLPAFEKREVFTAADSVPLVIAGQVIARIPLLDLLP